MTSDEAWHRYERLLRWRQARPDTIHSYQVALHSLWTYLHGQGVRWDRLTPDDVETWLAGRCQTGKRNSGLQRSKGTRHTYGTRAATFYREATLQGWITGRNPLAGWRPPRRPGRRPRAVPVPAIAQLLIVVDPRIRMMVLLGYHQALRVGEIVRLSVEDVALGADPPKIRVDGKGGREVWMELSGALVGPLRVWLATRPPSGPLIPNWRFPAEHLSARYASHMLAAVTRPVIGDSGHALRHTAATQLARLTKDPFVVQRALRHASVAEQSAYVDVELGAALALLPDPLEETR
jgi:integrase